MKQKTEANTQSRAWHLTINNPLNSGMTHEKIREILTAIPSLDYACLCDEIGEQGTPHTHIYIKTRNPLKFTTLKNKIPTAHLETAKGSAAENRAYIRKDGKHKDTDKKDTNLPDTFEEWGELPKNQQGERTDLEFLYDLVKEGCSNAEILEQCTDVAIKFYDKINRIRYDYYSDKYKSKRRLNLIVHYITGETGMGKSRDILDEFGDENVYRITDYQHPFDGYQLEPVIVFEEFRSSLRLQDMLNYLDIYPVQLPARYAPKVACYLTVFVVSNWTFEQQYGEVQNDMKQKVTYKAWVRRFNGFVKEYTTAGVVTYSSMQKYLKRNTGFRTLPQNTMTPFDKKNVTPDYSQDKMSFE